MCKKEEASDMRQDPRDGLSEWYLKDGKFMAAPAKAHGSL